MSGQKGEKISPKDSHFRRPSKKRGFFPKSLIFFSASLKIRRRSGPEKSKKQHQKNEKSGKSAHFVKSLRLLEVAPSKNTTLSPAKKSKRMASKVRFFTKVTIWSEVFVFWRRSLWKIHILKTAQKSKRKFSHQQHQPRRWISEDLGRRNSEFCPDPR